MKGGTLQINWHDTKPVLTLDFHPIAGLLATGGADYDIKDFDFCCVLLFGHSIAITISLSIYSIFVISRISTTNDSYICIHHQLWEISKSEPEKKTPSVSYQQNLSYHGNSVNALRFSTTGDLLASGADGGELILWKQHPSESGQTWKVLKSLLFHRKDILDIEWSPDSAFLISGSVDNSCIIWDTAKGCVHQILDSHSHYVQGVAWDPLNKYVASISSDRTCRVFVAKQRGKSKATDKINYVCHHVISKVEQNDDSKSSKSHLFLDETLPSFFRRLSFSPDGSFLLVPAGSYKASSSIETVNTAYVFSRSDLSRPAMMLPANKAVVAVRFCPVAFNPRGNSTGGYFKLSYRVIFAVATLNSLYIYDTESVAPIAVYAGLHYAAITDIAWSPDAKYLGVSSHDGYCTLVEFEDDELGTSFPEPLIKTHLLNVVVDVTDSALSTHCETGTPLRIQKTEPNKSSKKRITPMAVDP